MFYKHSLNKRTKVCIKQEFTNLKIIYIYISGKQVDEYDLLTFKIGCHTITIFFTSSFTSLHLLLDHYAIRSEICTDFNQFQYCPPKMSPISYLFVPCNFVLIPDSLPTSVRSHMLREVKESW